MVMYDVEYDWLQTISECLRLNCLRLVRKGGPTFVGFLHPTKWQSAVIYKPYKTNLLPKKPYKTYQCQIENPWYYFSMLKYDGLSLKLEWVRFSIRFTRLWYLELHSRRVLKSVLFRENPTNLQMDHLKKPYKNGKWRKKPYKIVQNPKTLQKWG